MGGTKTCDWFLRTVATSPCTGADVVRLLVVALVASSTTILAKPAQFD